MLRKTLLAMIAAVVLVRSAQAHFIWLDCKPAGNGQQIELYFGESPEPGAEHLIAKVAQAKGWVRTGDGTTRDLKFSPRTGDAPALVAAYDVNGAASAETFCDYGVYARGQAGPLLLYYAKRLSGDWASQPSLARSEKLKMDLVPSLAGNKLVVQAVWDGKPAANNEVTLIDPAGEQHDIKTDENGRVEIQAKAGHWSARAGFIEKDKSGERDGKKFTQTWHYCTLTLDVAADALAATTKTAAKEAALSAGDLLVKARDGRALWGNFPGFSADLTVHAGGQDLTGKMKIDGDGSVTLDMPKSPVADWVEEQLNSMVQHRMPDGEVSTGDVKYADDEVGHPLGRKIDLGDPSLQSAYRIKDDVIMEVNRNMGKMRFTISVLEIIRNAENKYLPRSFTMNFFDAASGDLRMSLAYLNEWQRVGEFDLPKTIIEVNAGKGGSKTKEIAFSNCQLLPKK